MMTKNDEVCQTCGKTFAWHEENIPRHPFNSGQDGATAFLGERQKRQDKERTTRPPQIASVPTDPVLRIALINRGIITPAELMAAEAQLQQALADVRRDDGQQAKSARWGQVQVGEATSLDVVERSISSQEVGTQSDDSQK